MEPKPGIPPTAQHILSLRDTVRNQQVKLIVMEDYFDEKAAKTLSENTKVKMLAIPAYTGGHPKANTYENWFDYLVTHMETGLNAK